MKNSNYFIKLVLAIVLIVTFSLQFVGCTGKGGDAKQSEAGKNVSDSTGRHLPIAFVRTDSLMAKYKFSIDLNDALMKKAEDKKLKINQQTENFRKAVVDYQQKIQMNAFLSQERQAQEENRLQNMRQDLENSSAQVQQEMAVEGAKMSQQLQDTIVAALKIYNTPKKFDLILSNSGTDNILYADDVYDITNEVVKFLNDRYVPSK